MMKIFPISILLWVICFPVCSQIRLEKLEISYRQSYKIIGSDILVVDTLVMRDSARIYLNPEIDNNIINAKVLIAGKGSMIIGRGTNGKRGASGIAGANQGAPCRNGEDGLMGGNGEAAKNGLNLSLYVGILKINGSLIIDVNGGDGGDGGRGGRGGDGGSGTRVCRGGNGGKGGNGGNGSSGGNGGNVLVNCKNCQDLHLLQGHQLFIKNYGGFAGSGGDLGNGGRAGLGSKQDGKIGARGVVGNQGTAGKSGIVTLEKS
ncbi:MAG: hypothetical protein HOP30_10850 [Cyclobacteriaceae bacterium]|nr:hypothetical protein [Cyclobacteriaceae bacterium]